MIRRIAANAMAMVSSQAAVRALGLVWLVVVARHLGQADFGTLNFALSLTALFSILVEFGFSPVLTRAVARDAALAESFLANVVGLRLALSIVAVPLAVGVSLVTGGDASTLAPVLVCACTMVTSGLWAAPASVFVAHERMGAPSAVITTSKVLALAAGLVLVARGAGLPAIAAVFLLEGLLNVAIGFPLLARVLGTRIRVALDPAVCRRLLREALPFTIALALGLVYFKVDVIMLSAMQGSVAVGLYSAAFRLLEGLVYVSSAFVGTMFPTISRLRETSPATLRSTVRRAADVVVGASVPVAVVLGVLASPVTILLYGSEYAATSPALSWIGAALPLVILNGFLSSVLGAVDRQKSCVVATLAGVVVNVALNLALIPRLAHVGAAMATAITQAAVLVVLLVLVGRHVRPGIDAARLAKITVAAGAMIAVLHGLDGIGVVARAAAGVGAYLVALAALRIVTAEERGLVRDAFRGGGS